MERRDDADISIRIYLEEVKKSPPLMKETLRADGVSAAVNGPSANGKTPSAVIVKIV